MTSARVLDMGPRLSTFPFAGRPVRAMSTAELEEVAKRIERERERVVGLNDDAGCITTNTDLTTIAAERKRRWASFLAAR